MYHGLGGVFAAGLQDGGLELVADAGMMFGAGMSEANLGVPRRQFLGGVRAEVGAGCPPCSGFSIASAGGSINRGPDADINVCMREFWDNASHVIDAEVIAMESVPQAFFNGFQFMRSLVNGFAAQTGKRWYVSHVLHSALALGSPQHRNRYLLVAHRDPNLTFAPPARAVTLPGERLALAPRWRQQDEPATSDQGVAFLEELALVAGDDWKPGEHAQAVYARHENDIVRQPPRNLHRTRFKRGQSLRPAYVMTADTWSSHIHPTRPRRYTRPELALLSGLPANWLIPEAQSNLAALGKAVTAEVGAWLARSITLQSGFDWPVRVLGKRERVVDARVWPEAQVQSQWHKPAYSQRLENIWREGFASPNLPGTLVFSTKEG